MAAAAAGQAEGGVTRRWEARWEREREEMRSSWSEGEEHPAFLSVAVVVARSCSTSPVPGAAPTKTEEARAEKNKLQHSMYFIVRHSTQYSDALQTSAGVELEARQPVCTDLVFLKLASRRCLARYCSTCHHLVQSTVPSSTQGAGLLIWVRYQRVRSSCVRSCSPPWPVYA